MRTASLSALAVMACLLLAPVASGQESGHGGGGKKPEPGTTVEMPYLVVPMSKDGKLLGYSYITSRLVGSSPEACVVIREKLAVIQDAYVREVNARPLGLASDPTAIDKEQLNARLTANAKRIAGDKRVVSMLFIDIKYAPLRPSASTDGNVPPPEQAPKGAATAAGAAGAAAANAIGVTTPPKDTAVRGEKAQKSSQK